MVYLIHFDQKFHHAQHYIGFVEKKSGMKSRLEYHRGGRGSRLLKAVALKGIAFDVVRKWPEGDRNFERSLKNKRNAPRLCPVCKKNKKLSEKLKHEENLVVLHSNKEMKTSNTIIESKDIETEEQYAPIV